MKVYGIYKSKSKEEYIMAFDLDDDELKATRIMNGTDRIDMKEDLKRLIKKCDECKLNECINCEISYSDIQTIKHLIQEYKNLKEIEESHRKENGELREKVKGLEENINKQKQLTKIAQTITDESIKEALIEFEKDYIPVSLIKEKIEELKKEKEYYYSDYKIEELNNKIQVLQELLEKRK